MIHPQDTNRVRGLTASLVVVLIVLIPLSQQGCTSGFSISANQASTSNDPPQKKTVFLLWWGLGDYTDNVNCDPNGASNGMKVVSARTNWLYALCTVTTLGAVVPMDVEYQCTAPPLQNGGVIGAPGGR